MTEKRKYKKYDPITRAAKLRRLEEWYRQKLALGTYKTIADELGLSVGYVENMLGEIRDKILADLKLNKSPLQRGDRRLSV